MGYREKRHKVLRVSPTRDTGRGLRDREEGEASLKKRKRNRQPCKDHPPSPNPSVRMQFQYEPEDLFITRDRAVMTLIQVKNKLDAEGTAWSYM